jgi:hypothetical protein
MDKAHPPETFGVFKPVDHTVIAFWSQRDLEQAVAALAGLGFDTAGFTRYSPLEMLVQIDAELLNKSPLASFGYELDLIHAHRVLAQKGCSFLVVHVPQKQRADQVTQVARDSHAATAQHYGTFLVEDLLEPGPGRTSHEPPV